MHFTGGLMAYLLFILLQGTPVMQLCLGRNGEVMFWVQEMTLPTVVSRLENVIWRTLFDGKKMNPPHLCSI